MMGVNTEVSGHWVLLRGLVGLQEQDVRDLLDLGRGRAGVLLCFFGALLVLGVLWSSGWMQVGLP